MLLPELVHLVNKKQTSSVSSMTSFSLEAAKNKAFSLATFLFCFGFFLSFLGGTCSEYSVPCHSTACACSTFSLLPKCSSPPPPSPFFSCSCFRTDCGSSCFLFQTQNSLCSRPSISLSSCLPCPLTRPTASISAGSSTASCYRRFQALLPSMWPNGPWKRWVTCCMSTCSVCYTWGNLRSPFFCSANWKTSFFFSLSPIQALIYLFALQLWHMQENTGSARSFTQIPEKKICINLFLSNLWGFPDSSSFSGHLYLILVVLSLKTWCWQ